MPVIPARSNPFRSSELKPAQFGLSQFEQIAQQLRDTGFVTLQQFLPLSLLVALHDEVKTLDQTQFKQAGIGRQDDFQINRDVRSDRILWVDEQSDCLRQYFETMESLRLHINRELLLGLFDYECHYAWYPEGAFYRQHVDAFRGRSNRRLSTVLYLNPDWQTADGGELVIYDAGGQQPLATIAPSFGTFVVFLSESFPHEVLPTRKARYSLTGWFRTNEVF